MDDLYFNTGGTNAKGGQIQNSPTNSASGILIGNGSHPSKKDMQNSGLSIHSNEQSNGDPNNPPNSN